MTESAKTPGNVVEKYRNEIAVPPLVSHPPGADIVRRVWITPDLMVGGTIQHPADLDHLVRDFGIAAVLNVETEHSDRFNLSDPETVKLLELPFWDHGEPIPVGLIQAAVAFARKVQGRRLYVHCQMGRARSPSFCYAILRGREKYTKDEALAKIKMAVPEYCDQAYRSFWRHDVYKKSIDLAFEEFDSQHEKTRAALAALVHLKDVAKKHDPERYEREKEPAWAEARAVLENL